MNQYFIVFLIITLSFCACKKDSNSSPDCIDRLIQEQKADISAVYSYSYQGKTVFDFHPQEECCDFFNNIYSEDCSLLCALNGIAGNQICNGDTFYLKARNKTLIWKK